MEFWHGYPKKVINTSHINRGKLRKRKLIKAAIIQFPFINKSKATS